MIDFSTDGKSKDRMAMQQDELEWIQYKDAMDWVIAKSGLPENVFFDVRGNHDKFGVPKVGSQVDYFSKYSISARLNRTATVQSITLKVRLLNYHMKCVQFLKFGTLWQDMYSMFPSAIYRKAKP